MRILLCVSGSISFYKTFELISLYKKHNISVKVLLSDGALKFINPLAYEALCDGVLTSNNESWENDKNHIAFSKDCDALVFAPASINSINKLANGICDNVFLSTIIAAKKPLIIAPAANTNMFLAPQTQKSIEILKTFGAKIINPVKKVLACGDEGIGALADVKDIFYESLKIFYKDEFYANKNILITGGGTKEAIDLVRNIGNYSSGKMADALAKEGFLRNANIVYLKANSSGICKENYKEIGFNSSEELKNLLKEFSEFDYLFMCAAVSDFIPIKIDKKLKRSEFKDELRIKIKANEDLLANCDFKGKKIGFKLEDDKNTAFDNAKKAFVNKKLDLLCLNILGEKTSFGSDVNEIYFCDKFGCGEGIFESKKKLAKIIFDKAKNV